MKPQRSIVCTAPARIADCGGWTDTWFAKYGAVCNLAVSPPVRVRIDASPSDGGAASVIIAAENFDEEYSYEAGGVHGRHPLLEAAIDLVGVPENTSLRIEIASAMPPGASAGTSAATSVALIGALTAIRGSTLSPDEVE